jgi:hypothetical protein
MEFHHLNWQILARPPTANRARGDFSSKRIIHLVSIDFRTARNSKKLQSFLQGRRAQISCRLSGKLRSRRPAVNTMAKQKTITETRSLLILEGQASERAWCAQCGAVTGVIALGEIGVVSNLDRQALEEWLNSRKIHRLRSADGAPALCLSSLLARVLNTETR